MDNKESRREITAIIPAYNEAERISSVLDILVDYGFQEVIVVDDGSTDSTDEVVRRYDVTLLKMDKNEGKGLAMDYAVKHASTKFIFFCDADVRNLTPEIISEIAGPVISGKAEMFVGMRSRGIYALTWILTFVPLLGGERALTKELWNKLPNSYKHKFRVETGLNFYAKYYGRGVEYKVFPKLKQVVKEQKYGFVRGFVKRVPMMLDIVYAGIKSELTEIPPAVAYRRRLYIDLLRSTVAMFFGVLLVVAAYFGPLAFVKRVFSRELLEDPNATFVHFLIRLAAGISVNTLALIGVVIVGLNMATLVFRIIKLRIFSDAEKVATK